MPWQSALPEQKTEDRDSPVFSSNPKLIISNLVLGSKIGNKKARNIFLLSILRIPYLLLYNYTSRNRFKVRQEHPYLSRLYKYLLKHISRELNLPIKTCQECRISYLPDYRTRKHQKYCPYGCVELNRRRNKQKAKSRYRKKKEAKLLASKYNHLYRERKQNGEVSGAGEIEEGREELERRLTAQIRFFYKRLNSGIGAEKLEQLDRILRKLSHRISTA